MRASIRELIKICSETLPFPEPIYEFGSLQVPGQEGFADLRPFFPGKTYVGADTQKGPGVDVVLDLHQIDLPSESAGSVLSLDTFEHVEYPRRSVEEIYRILKPQGIAVIVSVMNWPIHNFPQDYWRYTPEAFRSLLKPFGFSFVGYAGRDDFPETVVGIGVKGDLPMEVKHDFEVKFRSWKRRWSTSFAFIFQKRGGWRETIKLFIPPILVDLYRMVKGALKRASS